MANYYNEINELMDQLIYKILIYDKKGLKIGPRGGTLSLVDIHILKKMKEVENKKIYELVKEMEMDRSFVTAAVKKLVLNEYIEKKQLKDDKRVYTLNLTELGREIIEDVVKEQKSLLYYVLSETTLNEEKAILKFLNKINKSPRDRIKK